MNPYAVPTAAAEFLALDVETNGRGGDLCEMTEVGFVLVGGGELHESWSSVVRTQMPLSRGIQRFTGITQAMVDDAPPPEEVLPRVARMLEGRVLVAHNASFDRRVLRQAFDRAGIEWPKPPVVCTVNLARKFAPLVRERKLASLATALGIEVGEVHRALPDALTCARILCALLPKLCAAAPTVREATHQLQPRRREKRTINPIPKEARPDLSSLPKDPGVYIFRDESTRPVYVGKSVSLRTRARAHFCAPAGWTERAAIVDYRATNSELGALVLENRLIKEWKPTGNKALKRSDGWVFVRCRLDIEYPILEVAGDPAPGRAVNVGPLRGKDAAQDLVDHLNSMFKLRQCGRGLKRRDNPSVYGQMGRCCSPCLGDLDPNAYRRQIDKALAVFGAPNPHHALIEQIDAEMREASRAQLYERAAALLRRRERLDSALWRLEGVLRAMHARPRLILAKHPVRKAWDAFWVVGGRVVDWGALPSDRDEIAGRTGAALARDAGGVIPREEVDEVRIVAGWSARHEPPEIELGDPDAAAEWALTTAVAVRRSAGKGSVALPA